MIIKVGMVHQRVGQTPWFHNLLILISAMIRPELTVLREGN